MIHVLAWNTQGAKWDSLANDRLAPLIPLNTHDLLALTCESGWAPWVADGNVVTNNIYPLEGQYRWQIRQPTDAFSVAMHQQLDVNRNVHVAWIPWAAHPSELNDSQRTNSRCSMGLAWVPRRGTGADLHAHVDMFQHQVPWPIKRPTVRVAISAGGAATPRLYVFQVHLISGWWSEANRDISALFRAARQMIPDGARALLVGDMNLNLLAQPQYDRLTGGMPAGWRILRTGQATQMSGGELDFGLLYDPLGQDTAAHATWGPGWDPTPTNASDHAVVSYELRP